MSEPSPTPLLLLNRLAEHLTALAARSDPQFGDRFAQLNGRSIEIQCTRPATTAHLVFTPTSASLLPGSHPAPTVILRGPAASLAALLIPPLSGATSDVRIDGDETTLQALVALLRDFRPDLQAPLEQVLGRERAAGIAGGIDLGLRGLQALWQGLHASVDEKVGTYAASQFATTPEVANWLGRIDQLRLRVDRLNARIGAAERRRDPT